MKQPNLYIAVECFFILSGFLLCNSYFKLQQKAAAGSSLFLPLIGRRFRRLYPQYIFVTILDVVLILFGISIENRHISDLGFNLIMFGEVGVFNNLVPGTWYVSALFWSSFMLIGLLDKSKEKALYFWCPLIFVFSTVILYQGNSVRLHQIGNVRFGFLASGIIRGLAGLSCGMVAFYILQQKETTSFLRRIPNFIYGLAILAALSVICYLFLGKASKAIYNIYFAMALLVILLAAKPDYGNKIFSGKIWKSLSEITYMVFLTNIMAFEILRKNSFYNQMETLNRVVLAIIIILAVSYICYYAQKLLFGWLKNYFVCNNG